MLHTLRIKTTEKKSPRKEKRKKKVSHSIQQLPNNSYHRFRTNTKCTTEAKISKAIDTESCQFCGTFIANPKIGNVC